MQYSCRCHFDLVDKNIEYSISIFFFYWHHLITKCNFQQSLFSNCLSIRIVYIGYSCRCIYFSVYWLTAYNLMRSQSYYRYYSSARANSSATASTAFLPSPKTPFMPAHGPRSSPSPNLWSTDRSPYGSNGFRYRSSRGSPPSIWVVNWMVLSAARLQPRQLHYFSFVTLLKDLLMRVMVELCMTCRSCFCIVVHVTSFRCVLLFNWC